MYNKRDITIWVSYDQKYFCFFWRSLYRTNVKSTPILINDDTYNNFNELLDEFEVFLNDAIIKYDLLLPPLFYTPSNPVL